MGFMKGALAGGEQAETDPPLSPPTPTLPSSIPPSLTPRIIHHALGVGGRRAEQGKGAIGSDPSAECRNIASVRI